MTTPQYQSYPYIYSSKGLNAHNTIDRLPPQTYWNMQDAECRQEGSVASRLGRTLISGPFPSPPHGAPVIQALARLKGLNGSAWRYAGGNQTLYRSLGNAGTYSIINSGAPLSGQQFSSAVYRPSLTSLPYIFFADSAQMLKDNGSLNPAQLWGIFPPTAPPTLQLLTPLTSAIDDFEGGIFSYAHAGFTAATSGVSIVNTTFTAAVDSGVNVVAPVSMASIIANSLVSLTGPTGYPDLLVTQITTNTFSFYTAGGSVLGTYTVTNQGISLTTDAVAGTNHTVSRTFTGPGRPNLSQANFGSGFITIGVKLSSTVHLTGLTLLLDVGDGTFTQATYTSPFLTGASLPSTTGYTEIQIPISSFTAVGLAGQPGFTWTNFDGWQLILDCDGTPFNITLGDMSYVGGAGPSVADGGATPYDYRITFYNSVTGTESGPSVVQIPTNTVSPLGQPVLVSFAAAVTPPPPIDPQITDIRIYRRGGTLPDQWLQVGSVPIGTTSFIDTLTDEQAATQNILNVDTAPPVTSTLVVPVNTTLNTPVTVGENSVAVASGTNIFVDQMITVDPLLQTEETVIVQSVTTLFGVTTIKAYFQYPHAAGAIIQANTQSGRPVNIATIAFDRAWLAGDSNNPNILYYSDRFNPESFPVENFLEIGVPSDPIMAVMEWNGQLYVFTQNTVWNVLGAQGGSTPLPFKTAAKHGLNAMFGWAITEGEIYYQSFGGIYAFQGSDSRYASGDIEWIFTQQFVEDDVPRDVLLMDPAQVSQTVMAYYQNEIYIAYATKAVAGKTVPPIARVIYDKVHQRWRNDLVQANCMLVEDDIYTLLFGTTGGKVYQDRVGNYDQDSGDIKFSVQTASIDMGMPKNFKNFNEFTIDIDTGGIDANLTLLFDYGLTVLSLGTVNTGANGRGQFEYNLNAGVGQLSLNVAVLVTATIAADQTSPVELYEAHIRATVEAELRMSYDSYLMDFGSPSFNFVKQIWIEYIALDPGGINFTCYLEGSSIPEFTFNVPQSLVRTARRIRFPAKKARVWRWIGVSASPFRLYSDSRFEYKDVTTDKSYTNRPLQQEMGSQP